MRSGKVLSYNSSVRVGVIKDENGGKIKFFNEYFLELKCGMGVGFEIAFTTNGLMATSLIILKNKALQSKNKFF